VCPACDAHLTNPDDAVITNLNPTEDYKTSVLSGLSPNIIMECSGRALSFWAYQTTQEMYALLRLKQRHELTNLTSVYQEFASRSLTEKYTTLTTQMEKIINEANAEMSDLRNKMNSVCFEIL
jgi:E3 ubiquitin-protein ligase CCNP1IP1